MNPDLLNILACPLCKGKLIYAKSDNQLICKVDKLGFAVYDDIPVMLVDEAKKLSDEALKQYDE